MRIALKYDIGVTLQTKYGKNASSTISYHQHSTLGSETELNKSVLYDYSQTSHGGRRNISLQAGQGGAHFAKTFSYRRVTFATAAYTVPRRLSSTCTRQRTYQNLTNITMRASPTYSQTRQELLQEKLQDRRGEANYFKLMLRLSVDDEELLLLLRLLPSPPFQWNPHWKCFIGLCRELKAQEAFSNVMIGTLAGMTAITTVSIGPKIGRIAQKR